MSKYFLFLLLLPTICFAQSQYISAYPMDNPEGKTCKVLVNDYKPGSTVVYVGDCGMMGLKGVAAYIQAWNHANHIRIVRGQFNSGKAISDTKVTYINRVRGTITTFDEGAYYKSTAKLYKLDDVITDAVQSGIKLDGSVVAYVRLANYIDVFE